MAHEADIAITSGNSLTVAATLEAAKRAHADQLRNDPVLFARMKRDAAEKLVKIPPRSKGVTASNGAATKWA